MGGDSMSDDILNAMRALREDMRQRLMQAPEYRALVALDRAIDEVCAILHDPASDAAPAAMAETKANSAPQAQATPAAPPVEAPVAPSEPPLSSVARHNAIAAAFAETLAARLDQRGARASATYPAGRRVHFD
jgi:pyruvate/2-oxoglutarate dehydrogenase complex dihydrolipoamide acyltransferase (E2) component